MIRATIPKLLLKFRSFYFKIHSNFNILCFSDQAVMATGVKLLKGASIHNLSGKQSGITIGENSVILGDISVYGKGASIQIGRDAYVGPSTNIMAFCSITIGSRAQISHNVNIYDNNSHSVSASLRFEHMRTILTKGHPEILEDIDMSPIEIGDDAWIGFGSTILKGVRIGRGAIIGAGSMITKDVEDYSIVVGNPQRQIGNSRP